MRRRIAVLFGGQSGEHEVSIQSALSVMGAMDREKYEVIPVGITREGQWYRFPEGDRSFAQGINREAGERVLLSHDPTHQGFLPWAGGDVYPVDCVFPVLHGPYGEDGTVQGLMDMSQIPYVGAGVLASSVGMDKVLMRQTFRQAGLAVVPDFWFFIQSWHQDPVRVEDAVRGLGYPVFVKPANLGSSVGIAKVKSREGLAQAILEAASHDPKVLIEKSAGDVREIEVSVLGNLEPRASVPGEIRPSEEFYSYNAKYHDDRSQLIIPATLSAHEVKTFQTLAIRAFQAIDGSGLARVDFFMDKRTGQIWVNEINTMPGFTKISMYPKLWEASGLPYGKLIEELISLAFDRHENLRRRG